METIKHKKKEAVILLLVVVFLIVWGLLVYTYGPEGIVGLLNVQNAYLLMFSVALFGGLSTFTSPTFLATLVTLTLGGLNPLLLVLVTGVGLTLSDSFFFYAGVRGRGFLRGKWLSRSERLGYWIKGKPPWAPSFIVFIYTGFFPLPNDILMAGLALINVRYRNIFVALLLGDFTLSGIIVLLTKVGITPFI